MGRKKIKLEINKIEKIPGQMKILSKPRVKQVLRWTACAFR